MAFGNLTVDFKQLMSVPLQQRVQLARSSASSEIFGNLSPTEVAKLFPKYYKDHVPAVGNLSGATTGYSGGGGAGNTSTASPSGSSSSGNNTAATPPPPPMSAIDRIIEKARPQPRLGEGDIDPKNRRSLLRGTYDAFRRAGYTDSQSRALVSEVGRENSFRPGIMFGQHAEPGRRHKGRPNAGIFSMAGPRRDGLMKYMASQGLMNESGNGFVFSQASLDAMARYARMEMTGHPDAPISGGQIKAAQRFLANEDVTHEEGIKDLSGWIAWDIAGRHHDASASFNRLNSHRREIDGILEEDQVEQSTEEIGTLDGATAPAEGQRTSGNTDINLIDVDNPDSRPNGNDVRVAPVTGSFDPSMLDPALLQQYQSASDTKKKQFEEAVMRKGYDWANNIHKEHATQNPEVTATEIVQQGQPDQNIKPVPGDAESLREFWSQRNPRTDIDRIMEVDPDLLKANAEAIQQYEAANPRYRVELFGDDAASRRSGSTANHGIKADGYSKALDFVIIDRETGKQITNIGRSGYAGQVGGSELASKEYTRLHSLARIAQEHFSPHETDLRHGGGFTDGGNAADWQHNDIRAGDEVSGQYSWKTGYTDAWRRKYNIQENLVLGDEQRIRELGQQIYGQVDEEGNYVNRAAFAQREDGNVTVVAQPNKRLEESVADVQAPADTEATQPVDNPTADIQAPVTTTPLVPPSATPAEEPRNMMLGGTSPNLVNEGVQITNTDTGEQVNVNDREQISTDEHGNLHVKSAHKVKAEELQDKYENKPLQQNNPEPEPDMPQEPEKQHKPPEPQANMGKMTSVTEPNRLDKTPLDMSQFYGVPPSPSFGRAMHQARLGEIRATRGNANEV